MKYLKGPNEDVLFLEASEQDQENDQKSEFCCIATLKKKTNSEQLKLPACNLGRHQIVLLFYMVLLCL